MRAVADTHTAIWYLWEPDNLSTEAVKAMDESMDLSRNCRSTLASLR